MSDLYTLIAGRLAPRCLTAASVSAATSAEEVEALPVGVQPTLLVVPAGERWSPPRDASILVRQEGRIAFSVIVALTRPGGAPEWSQVRAEIRAALLGWLPPDPEVSGPIEAVGARLLAWSADQGGLWVHGFDFACPAQFAHPLQD